ncbi:MAG TPA: LytTR family DNA-binding domain-containing protein [Chitinophagaceae bacterium]|nr:LytTR family DNA-binding domain-containing protein [Chitinophagaceae bacterium]
MIRTIIIDDEPSSVNVLSMLLKKNCKQDVQIIATTNSPLLGKTLIEEHRPGLVFLDIEMPGMSGIDLLRSFTEPDFRVVFITAFDAYAIEAFRLSAIDYLLKPVEADDITRVIGKIKKDISKNENTINIQLQNLQKLLQQNHAAPESKIGIGMADKIVFVNIAEILYCEANGAYTSVYLHDGKKIVSSKSLGEFESQLMQQKFFRIHHSTLINLNHVKEFQRFDGGYVVMENNVKLEVSQRKRKDFLDSINGMIV